MPKNLCWKARRDLFTGILASAGPSGMFAATAGLLGEVEGAFVLPLPTAGPFIRDTRLGCSDWSGTLCDSLQCVELLLLITFEEAPIINF